MDTRLNILMHAALLRNRQIQGHTLTELQPYTRFSLVPQREPEDETKYEGEESVPVEEVKEQDQDDADAYNKQNDVQHCARERLFK